MKIVKAMKKVARLKGEVRELKKRMNSCLNTIADNEFDEKYVDLQEELFSKISEVINLKTMIMHTNVKGGMFAVIVNLGELKSYMEYLKELEPKIGVKSVSDYSDEKVTHKSQLSIKEKNVLVRECQDTINRLTDGLDDFNAKTDLEIVDMNTILFQ